MSKQKVTLSTIAQKTGLSIASVSRAINKPHVTNKETLKRVNQAVEELGYDKKFSFKPYVTHRNNYQILVIDNQLIQNNMINHGIESKAKDLGYKLVYMRFIYFDEYDIHQIINHSTHHQVDGILIINNSPYVKLLLKYQISLPPMLLVNHFSLELSCVYFDHLSIGFQATKYLIEQDHKRIAILLGDINDLTVSHVKNGYMQALMRSNIPVLSEYITSNCFDYMQSQEALKNMMKLPSPPTAIICSDHLYLTSEDKKIQFNQYKNNKNILIESSIYGVLDQCQKMDIKIPNDLSVLQFIYSKSRKSNNQLHNINAIYKPLFKMGIQSVELLTSIIDSTCKIRLARLIESELVSRN